MASTDRLRHIANEAKIILAMYPKVYGRLRQAIVIVESIRRPNPEFIYPRPTPEEKLRDLQEAQENVEALRRQNAVWTERVERLAEAIAETFGPEYSGELRYILPYVNPAWHDNQGFDWQEAVKELRDVWEFATHEAAAMATVSKRQDAAGAADESGDAADGERFAELAGWTKKGTNLKGNQRRVVELLIENDGRIPLSDLASEIGWQPPFDNAFNSLRGHLNKKLRKVGWKVSRQDNNAHLETIRSSAKMHSS
jgi:hypothetical protein